MDVTENKGFDDYAQDYRRIHSHNIRWSGADSDHFARFKAGWVMEREGPAHRRILDIGSGDGAVEAAWLSLGAPYELVGVDTSAASVEQARARGLAQTEFLHYGGEALPFPNKRFDVVFLACVLHHVPFEAHVALLREAFRVLVDGGRIYMFEHNPWNPLTRYAVRTCPFDHDARLLRSGYARKQLKEAGFVIQGTSYLLFFPRHRWCSPLWRLEPALRRIPLGAQYVVTGVK